MAVRPVFVVDDNTYVRVDDTEFKYYNGFSKAQRQRSSRSLQDAFKMTHPGSNMLEVSRFSDDILGNELSAFNLMIGLKDGTRVPVEAAFQGGKIFENGGPYKDLLKASPKDAKRDPRLHEKGRVIGFEFEGESFPTFPATLYYTWLYLHALNENEEIASDLIKYDAFTDIVFNPNKSINCQAYVCAVYTALQKKGEFDRALTNMDFLSGVLKKTISPCS